MNANGRDGNEPSSGDETLTLFFGRFDDRSDVSKVLGSWALQRFDAFEK